MFRHITEEFDLHCIELQQSRNITGSPMYILVCLLELTTEEVDKKLQFCHRKLHQVMIQSDLSKASPIIDTSDLDSFITIGRMLTTFWAAPPKCQRTCEEHTMLLYNMGKYNDQFVSCLPESRQVTANKRMKCLQKRIDFVRDWTQAFRPGTRRLS